MVFKAVLNRREANRGLTMRAKEFLQESKKDLSNGGDCFESALKELMNSNPFGKDHMDNMTLVHAVVTGQGEIEGVKHGHAWNEVGDIVIDKSNGRNIVMRKEQYYKAGNINPANRSEFKRYTRKEMANEVKKHKTYGPWDLPNDIAEITSKGNDWQLHETEQLNENPAVVVLLRGLAGLLARIGVKRFSMWLLTWLFTTTVGLTITGILALIQLIVGITINAVIGGTTMGTKALYNAFKNTTGEEEADRLMAELETKLNNDDFDMPDKGDEVDMEPLDNRDLYQLANQLNEADVEYSASKPGKRMHTIGDVYGKKKTKLPTAKYKDNRNNSQKGIFK